MTLEEQERAAGQQLLEQLQASRTKSVDIPFF